MATATKTSSSSGTLKTIGAIVVILGIVGYASSQGWIGSNRFAPEEDQSDQERELVTFEVRWGQVVETGEEYEDTGRPRTRLECVNRGLEITIFIDGDEEVMQQHVSDVDDPCLFRHSRTVAQGAEVRMVVREVEVFGWKMCQLRINGQIALPNGWAISPDDGPCEVWAVAL